MDLKIFFDNLIKETVTPQLKSLNFKKKGNNFCREIGSIIQCFNIQQSRWNHAESKHFIFNIGLIHKNTYQRIKPHNIPSFPKEYDCLIQTRSNQLTHGHDFWYEITPNSSLELMKNDITNDFIDTIRPFLLKYQTLANWSDFILNDDKFLMSPFVKVHLFSELGLKKEASVFWKNFYNESKIPQRSKSTTRYPNGNEIVKFSAPKVNYDLIKKIEVLASELNIELTEN